MFCRFASGVTNVIFIEETAFIEKEVQKMHQLGLFGTLFPRTHPDSLFSPKFPGARFPHEWP